ncbi:hypothetical protein QAD02_008607 [Eretmocerus hayati]|uniref:Uncharacterized protein n=1 Tax=Eretmocerus hayati TaxID=131215 RepID=A0ACC2NBE3_9HYME|nr:hypothetical protein QAD02_008607 [Eretmocerus hayati]
MSTCMERVSHIISLAKSPKVSEYKKAIKSMLEFLDESDFALEQITEYSKDPLTNDGFTSHSWNEIFSTFHELFIQEIDRISKLSGNSGKLDKERIVKLIYLLTDKANYYLKPKNVVRSTLQILQIRTSKIYSEYFEMYLGILKKCVLQERSQRILVDPPLWQDLLSSCISILKKKIEHVDYVKLLEVMELLVLHGCSLSTLLLSARSLLFVINDLLENYESYNIKSVDILFKLSFTTCQQIASDSRFMLCKFAESMPLSFINLKGPDEKYQLYFLLVQAHHPKGAILGDGVSHAHDEEKWKAILNLLYKMIINDLRPVRLSKSLIALACEVFRQRVSTKVSNSQSMDTFQDSLYIQPKKKRRLSDQEKVVDLINDRDADRAWPMIQIAISLYKKYPDCLQRDEYIELLEVTIKLMNQASKNFPIMESLCELSTVLLKNEKKYDPEDSKAHWDKTWDLVLRYLSMSHKEILQNGFLLVQSLISHGKISNPNSLLKLYLTKSIQVTNFSILALETLCENFTLPHNMADCDMNTSSANNSLKLQLMQWTLNAINRRPPSPIILKKLSKMLIGFTLKTWYRTSEEISDDDPYDKHCVDLKNNSYEKAGTITTDDIDKCYLSVKLKMDFPKNESNKNKISPAVEETNENPFVAEDLDVLSTRLVYALHEYETDQNLTSLIVKTALVAKIISDLKALKMITFNFSEFCLVGELQMSLTNIFDQVHSVNWSKSIRYTLDVTEALILLYQPYYDVLVNDLILTSTSLPTLKKIYDVFKLENDEFQTDTKITQCKLNVVIVLASFCCLNSDSEMMDLQVKIASTILKLHKYQLYLDSDVVCVVTMLDIFSKIPHAVLTNEFIDIMMDFVEEIFDQWRRDDRINRCLLRVLPKLVEKILHLKDEDRLHNALLICKHYHDDFDRDRFGQMTHLSLVQCLNSMVKMNVLQATEEKVIDPKVFVTFVKSPFYLVRLTSLQCIHSILSMKNLGDDWKKEFFDNLVEAVTSFFLLQREMTSDEKKEERILRSISTMQIFGTVFCSGSAFQSSALLNLLLTSVERNFDMKVVKEILMIMNKVKPSSKSILEENLNYLVTSWLSLKDLSLFPHSLLECSSETEFCEKHISTIFPVLIRERKTEVARILCERLGASFVQVFESSCTSIIPWSLADEFADILEKFLEKSELYKDINDLATLIKNNLESIIIQLVKRLVDPFHFHEMFETTTSLPRADPPHFKAEVVDQCFKRLNQFYPSKKSQELLHFLITHKPSSIQRVMLHFITNVYKASTTEYKAEAFHQYAYFCSKLAEFLPDPSCEPVSAYFIKDIGFSVLNLTKDGDEFIKQLACKYLLMFFKAVLPNRSVEVGIILDSCVKTLVPLIRKPKEESIAKDVLQYLLIEQKDCLSCAIENLGSLPSFLKMPNDQEVKTQTLIEVVSRFVTSVSDDKSCSVDALEGLRRHLRDSSRAELEAFYEQATATNWPHRLVHRLIRLSGQSDQEAVRLEAAKCLAELGPADLGTLILLPPETTASTNKQQQGFDPVIELTQLVVKQLAELALSADIELRTVCSDVLYAILDSAWGLALQMKGFCADKALESFLVPFKSSQRPTSGNESRTKVKVDIDYFQQVFNPDNILWSELSNQAYKTWLHGMASSVASCFGEFYTRRLTPVFCLNIRFCEITLPHLVTLVVQTDPRLASQLCCCINRFFNYHFYSEFNHDIPLSGSSQNSPRFQARDAIRCMLGMVSHLRIHHEHSPNQQQKQQSDCQPKRLELDYLPIAMAAQFCSAYFSSVLYAELWCSSILPQHREFDPLPIIDQVYEFDAKLGRIAQNILKEAYTKIGDSDSLHGCGSSHLHCRGSRIPYYANFQKLDKLVLAHDVELSVASAAVASGSSCTTSRGMINALKDSSLHFLAKRLLETTVSGQDDTMDDLCYDSLWRLSDWSQVTDLRMANTSKRVKDFATYHYEALKNMHENDKTSLKTSLKQAYLCITKDLSGISLESCEAVYPKLCQLQMLREIEEFSSTHPDNVEALLSKWNEQKFALNNNFQYTEPILSQRAVMFNIHESMKDIPVLQSASINVQLECARLAQDQGHFHVAARVLETLAKKANLNNEAEDRLLYHEARLAWSRKDEDLAKFNLRILVKKNSVNPNLLCRAFRVYGNWIAESKSENPQKIINNYYEKAIETYMPMENGNTAYNQDRCKAIAALAQFAHEQYLVITDYMRSPQFESLKECLEYTRNVVEEIDVQKNPDQDVRHAVMASKRHADMDSTTVENTKRDQSYYLNTAIKNYALSLREGDDHDLLVFRLVSLWLDNTKDDEVNATLNQHLEFIPSYKFISLIPQLAPHMSDAADCFTVKISLILERCAEDHPHHTLPVLLALRNLHKDARFCGKRVVPDKEHQEPRVLGAENLLRKLFSTPIRPIVQEMNLLSTALVQLAYSGEKKGLGEYPMPRNLKIHEIKDFHHCLVPTITIDVKKNKNYQNIVSVAKYEPSYRLVGGVNAPKKLKCLCTDGIERPQLIKGKDDLRQDAVMQQVFTVMNSLLKSNKDAKQRKLYVRTYKVVPLTQRSGLLEWCSNTLPLGIVLVGDKNYIGLHRKYYPNDWDPAKCKNLLLETRTTGVSALYAAYQKCCENFHPAFHHFFTEKYLAPEIWFERRLAYTRSVATTSIIGYILGLGDRHVSNILLDISTAEVVHIDFGIAFEQGKVLPTPETVPFRLSRDIEIAMGVSGVEGTMRRCCEETMTVLREQREIIVTLLRVLLYDPLYSWAITPARAATYQSEQSNRSSDSKESSSPGVTTETNKMAERALLRVQQKLQGIEEGVASSIAGQVERLIQTARDPHNLCRLYIGWQAYL